MAQRRSTWREYAEALIVAGLFLTFANTFVLKTFFIPSGSMENTLLIGDHLVVNRFVFGPTGSELERRLLPNRSVRRGDIVVFRSPEDPHMDLVKRCIALGGDTVMVRDKHLYVNDQRVDDSTYVIHSDARVGGRNNMSSYLVQRDQFGPYKVPADHYFCMGDNRDLSYDSRFWGPLPAQMVLGRVSIIYWSFGGETLDGNWHGFGALLAHLGRTLIGFPTKTRWSRTFRIPH